MGLEMGKRVSIVGHGKQYELWASRASKIGYVGGMGSGKTMSLVVKCLIHVLDNPGTKALFIEPTYGLIWRAAWPELKQRIEDFGLRWSLRRSEAMVIINHGGNVFSEIHFLSGQNPERIVATEYGIIIIDEFAMMPEQVFIRALQRLRNTKSKYQQIILGGTPEGAGTWAHKLMTDSKNEFVVFNTRTFDNPHLPDGYIEGFDHMSQEERDAYLEGKWIAMGGSVYHRFNRAKHLREGENPFDPKCAGKLEVWADFNIGKMAWLVVINYGHTWHVIDEWFGKNADTEQHAEEFISDKLPQMRGQFGWAPLQRADLANITFITDAAGKQRRTSASKGKTDVSILRHLGFTVHHKKRNPGILDSVQSVNHALYHEKLHIDPKCVNTIETLEALGKDDKGMPAKAADPTKGLDHASDCLRYGVDYHGAVQTMRGRSWQGT